MSHGRGASLVYKCRLCSQAVTSCHVPDGDDAWLYLIGSAPRPLWGVTLKSTSIHSCGDGRMGVTDFAGIEYDKPEST